MQIHKLKAQLVGLFLAVVSTTAGAWSINDNYDSQNLGDRCGVFWASAQDSTVTNLKASSGSKSCRFRINKGGTGWGGGFVLPSELRRGDELWIRFRLFIPQGFDYNAYGAGDRLKFIRITTKNSAGTPLRLDWYWQREGKTPPFAVTLEGDNCTTNCWQGFGSANDKPARGTWETYEIYAKFDTAPANAGGQGRVRTWKNGKLMGDLTDRPTMNNSGDTIVSAMVFSYWNGTSPATQELYFDDLVSTNVRPSAKDSAGNPYIGVGNFVAVAPPMPPSSIN